jgi:tRNA(Ile2) C34 agmatinyltransferase TiaS
MPGRWRCTECGLRLYSAGATSESRCPACEGRLTSEPDKPEKIDYRARGFRSRKQPERAERPERAPDSSPSRG